MPNFQVGDIVTPATPPLDGCFPDSTERFTVLRVGPNYVDLDHPPTPGDGGDCWLARRFEHVTTFTPGDCVRVVDEDAASAVSSVTGEHRWPLRVDRLYQVAEQPPSWEPRFHDGNWIALVGNPDAHVRHAAYRADRFVLVGEAVVRSAMFDTANPSPPEPVTRTMETVQPGDRVRCLRNLPGRHSLVVGQCYTVLDTCSEGSPYIRLVEQSEPPVMFTPEHATYSRSRFEWVSDGSDAAPPPQVVARVRIYCCNCDEPLSESSTYWHNDERYCFDCYEASIEDDDDTPYYIEEDDDTPDYNSNEHAPGRFGQCMMTERWLTEPEAIAQLRRRQPVVLASDGHIVRNHTDYRRHVGAIR